MQTTNSASNVIIPVVLTVLSLIVGELANLHAATLLWVGPDGGVWDESTANWTGDATTYTEGDNVRFRGDTGTQGAVAIRTSGVAPNSFDSPSGGAGTWTFTGGDIMGSTSIQKGASGSTFIFSRDGSYTFTGGVFASVTYAPQLSSSGLTVHVGSDGSGGGGNITGGSFTFLPSQPATLDNIFINPSGIAGNANASFASTVQMGTDLSFSGQADFSGLTLNMTGNRQLTVRAVNPTTTPIDLFDGTINGTAYDLTVVSSGGGGNAACGISNTGAWDVTNVIINANGRKALLADDGSTAFDGVIANGGKVGVKNGYFVKEINGSHGNIGTFNIHFPLEVQSTGIVAATTIAVAADGSVGGVGTLDANVIVADGGTIAPGLSIGTLTVTGDLVLNDTSVLDYEFDNTTSDLIAVAGDLTLDGTLNASQASIGTEYTLFTYDGSLLADNGLQITGLASYLRAEIDTVGGEVTFLAIPEPATGLLVGLLSLGLMRRRR